MTLAAPKLDDRRFQDIVDEARKRIPHYCPEWTDHNVSDPGVTLIELFAWMTEIILYRLNQVPDLHYIKFLDMLGVSLQPPVAARVPVTFWLSAPVTPSNAIKIPAGTQVASTQTETQPSIVFTTDADFEVQPPQLSAIKRRVNPHQGSEKDYPDLPPLRHLLVGLEKGVEVFTPKPAVNDALYFGFKNDLSHHILRFDLDFDRAAGADVNPAMPPLVWEACVGEKGLGPAEKKPDWRACQPEIDTIGGMSKPGQVQLHLPKMSQASVKGEELFWVRVKIKKILDEERHGGMRPYTTSPKLIKVRVDAWGATVWASHAQHITDELLGQSDGSPDQRFRLQVTPILKRTTDEILTVRVESQPPQVWTEVGDFAASGEGDLHFTLDRLNGELRFGPAVRQPTGDVKPYGAVPPRGAKLILPGYWSGGGQAGNVRAGILNTLKTAIPYIARVENQVPAHGGRDAESLEAAKLRARAELRTRERAVTPEDFEFFACRRPELRARIARVKCLQLPTPGQVDLLVIPSVANPAGYLEPDQLELEPELIQSLYQELDERRLLATPLTIRSPGYRWVAVKVGLMTDPEVGRAGVEQELEACLYRFLNPLTGGATGSGWPFGHKLSRFDLYRCLPDRRDVRYCRVEMYAVAPGDKPGGVPIEELPVCDDEVIASGRHVVEFVPGSV